MPRKDPEEFKKYQREQMRQRRAQAKEQKAGDNLPPATPGQSISPPAKALEKPNKPAPASNPEYQVDWKKRKKDKLTGPENLRGEGQGVVTTRRETPPRPQPINFLERGQHFAEAPVEGYWSRFPGQAGRPCFNDARYACCYDPNFPVNWERWYCPCLPKTCNYSKPLSLFDLAGAVK